MKKASNILFLVGTILSSCALFACVIGAILFANFSDRQYTSFIVQGIEDGVIEVDVNGSAESQARYIQSLFSVLAFLCSFEAVILIPNIVLSALGRKKDNKVVYILNMVFGILSGVVVNAVGGIFGIIAQSNENNSHIEENNSHIERI